MSICLSNKECKRDQACQNYCIGPYLTVYWPVPWSPMQTHPVFPPVFEQKRVWIGWALRLQAESIRSFWLTGLTEDSGHLPLQRDLFITHSVSFTLLFFFLATSTRLQSGQTNRSTAAPWPVSARSQLKILKYFFFLSLLWTLVVSDNQIII